MAPPAAGRHNPRRPRDRDRPQASGQAHERRRAGRGRDDKRVAQPRQSRADKEEERQRRYLEQLNEQASLAMRVLEREKVALSAMKEKVKNSPPIYENPAPLNEGQRKMFHKSQIPGLSPEARKKKMEELQAYVDEEPQTTPPPHRQFAAPVSRPAGMRNLDEIAELHDKESFLNADAGLPSPGYDSPVHSPVQHKTPIQAPRVGGAGAYDGDDHDKHKVLSMQKNLEGVINKFEFNEDNYPPSVQKRIEILKTMHENRRRQMAHNSIWSVDDPSQGNPVIAAHNRHGGDAGYDARKGGFLSAMRDLQGGPSEEQRRIALIQRRKLIQDLDEQVMLKREEKRKAKLKRIQQDEAAELRLKRALQKNAAQEHTPPRLPPPAYPEPTVNQAPVAAPPMQAPPPRMVQPPPAAPPAFSHQSPVRVMAPPPVAFSQQSPTRPAMPPMMDQAHHSAVGAMHPPPMSVHQSPIRAMPLHEPQNPTTSYHVEPVPPYHPPLPPPPRVHVNGNVDGQANGVQQRLFQDPKGFQNLGDAQAVRRSRDEHDDAISKMLSEIRQEQLKLKEQFQEQMHVVTKLEEEARHANHERERAVEELHRAKEHFLPSDALDEFMVESNLVPKDVSTIPDESELSDISIKTSLIDGLFGAGVREDVGAGGGFPITRQSVYLEEGNDEEEEEEEEEDILTSLAKESPLRDQIRGLDLDALEAKDPVASPKKRRPRKQKKVKRPQHPTEVPRWRL